jgi:hypothetical protein
MMLELPEFLDSRHMKVVRLSALSTGRPYRAGSIPGTHFCQRPNRRQGHSAAGRIVNYTIGNRTRDLPACSVVPQPTGSPHAPRPHPPCHIKTTFKKGKPAPVLGMEAHTGSGV